MTDRKLYHHGPDPRNYCYHGFWMEERVTTSWGDLLGTPVTQWQGNAGLSREGILCEPRSRTGQPPRHEKTDVGRAQLGQVGLR